MAAAVGVPAIWGIGAGLFVVVLAAIIAVFCYLRRRHKAPRETINRTVSQRRAHLSLTDEDVSRMPGMRRLRPTPYNHPPGWAPISSRESVTKKAWTPNPADVDPVTGLPPWPVRIPRRLKKSQSSPVVRLPPTALSPITERSTNNTATSPSLSTVTNLDHNVKSQPNANSRVEVYRSSGRPPSLDSSPGLLRPKPLFHGSLRSSSHGNLATSTFDPRVKGSAPASTEEVELQNLQLDRMPRSSSLCSQQPGQAPDVPMPPLPIELPASKKAQLGTIPTDLSPQRVSGISLLSGDTSVLDESASRAFSHAETDFTSISLTSPLGSHSPIGLGISTDSSSKWNFSRIDRSASPLSASKARNIRPQISQQHSIRASVHNSLPRSASSGLSVSLLDRTSPNPKAALDPPTSTLKVPPRRQSRVPQLSPLSGLNVFHLNEERTSKRASTSVLQAVSGNQSSPIKNPWTDRPSSIATEDPFRWDPKTSMQPGKPSAMKNPAQRHKRRSTVRISNIPTIIPSSNPYRLSSTHGQPSISPLTSPLSRLSNTNNNNNIFNPTIRPQSTTSLRSPSLSTFNPQLPKGIRASHHSPRPTNPNPPKKENTPYSPTFSMIPLYAPPSPTPSSSPFSSAPSTPTRKPPSSHHPNRRHAIFPPGAGWPPLLTSSITPQDPPTDLLLSFSPPSAPKPVHQNQQQQQQQQQQQPNHTTTSSSLFQFQFPSPPLPTHTFFSPQQPPPRHPGHTLHLPPPSPSKSKSKSPPRHTSTNPKTKTKTTTSTRIHGPRTPPPARITKPSSSTTSPTHRTPAKIRRSIIELRRMNSEVVALGSEYHDNPSGKMMEGRGHGHGRYLSLGGRDEEGSLMMEEGEGKEEGEREEGREDGGRGKGICTPKRNRGQGRGSMILAAGTPGSLYDGAGFLRDREGGGGGGGGEGVAV